MTPQEYVKNAVRTESPAQGVIDSKRIEEPQNRENLVAHLEHTVDSLQGLDVWKKFIFYGKNSDAIKNIGWADIQPDKRAIINKCKIDVDMVRILHGSMGIATEAGELFEAILKHVVEQKEIDKVNLAEEVGDVMWYVAILCDTLGVDLEKVMETNIAKLKARFPNKFTEENAINRDLNTERKILEA